MPEIKSYERKKNHHKKHGQKRRPYHDMDETMAEREELMNEAANHMEKAKNIKAEANTIQENSELIKAEADAINTEAQNEGVTVTAAEALEEERMTSEGGPADSDSADHSEKSKIHLHFYGSELIRQKAPKVMELADTVAQEWVSDGKFEGLPVGNPLAQMAAAKTLRTAKDVEKKLDEKGVFTVAKMGLDFIKSKIEKKNK
ncbi:MAG: hypothetical protein ACXVCY_07445 [Pseudobdellovibrionaceae bacterium]